MDTVPTAPFTATDDPQPFAALSRWLDMFDEIRAIPPKTEK